MEVGQGGVRLKEGELGESDFFCWLGKGGSINYQCFESTYPFIWEVEEMGIGLIVGIVAVNGQNTGMKGITRLCCRA